MLGLWPMDARRSKDRSFDLAPSADRIVGPTSGMFLKKPTAFPNDFSLFIFRLFGVGFTSCHVFMVDSRLVAHEQDHGFGVEIWIVELRADEVVEVVGFLERQQLGLVDLFEALANCGEELRLVLFSPLENSGHCYGDRTISLYESRRIPFRRS